MPKDTNTQALRKRQQIERASKNMFIWVAGAAIILGVCVVLAASLYERIVFKQEVINTKNETVDNLKKNITTAKKLEKEVRVLNTNRALLDTPRLPSSEPISVILDALPSNANSNALGASLQQKLLGNLGVTIESLTVEPIAGVEDIDDDSSRTVKKAEGTINFQFSVSVGAEQEDLLQEALRRLERSIRTINLKTVTVERQGAKITMSVEGEAYYQSATKVELSEKSVK